MNDSPVPESPRPASGSNDDPTGAALAAVLQRLPGSELACCCGLALRVRELSGGRRCRVEVSGGRPETSGGGNGSRRSPSVESDPGWHRIALRGPGSPERPEAWLAVERRGDEPAPPHADRLSALAPLAGLALERHRLAREVRRARSEAKEVRGVLGHVLRGHLHAALLRADNLLLSLREDGSSDLGQVREQLGRLKETVEDMAEEIREVVEEPDVRRGASPRPPSDGREQVDVPGLLREAGGSRGDGDIPFRVEVQGEIPAVRADPGRLGTALGELVDLVRRSRAASPLTVRPDPASSGARVDLSVELPPLPGPDGGREEPDDDVVHRPGDGTGGDDPGGTGASLREAVTELGGVLRVEAGPGTRATVEVILPADAGS